MGNMGIVVAAVVVIVLLAIAAMVTPEGVARLRYKMLDEDTKKLIEDSRKVLSYVQMVNGERHLDLGGKYYVEEFGGHVGLEQYRRYLVLYKNQPGVESELIPGTARKTPPDHKRIFVYDAKKGKLTKPDDYKPDNYNKVIQECKRCIKEWLDNNS